MTKLINNDATQYRRWFSEMASMLGYPDCKYQYFEKDKTHTLHGEILGTYSDLLDIDLIMQENINQETVKTLGWLTEGGEAVMVQVPYDTPHIERGCRIHIPYAVSGDNVETKIFRITKLTTLPRYPDSWYCLIAPEYESDFRKVDPPYKDNNFNYIKT